MELASIVLAAFATALALLATLLGARGRSSELLWCAAFLALAVASLTLLRIEVPPLPDDEVPPVRPCFVALGFPLGLALALASLGQRASRLRK